MYAIRSYYDSTPTAAQLSALAALRGPGDAWAAAAREQYEATGRSAAERNNFV